MDEFNRIQAEYPEQLRSYILSLGDEERVLYKKKVKKLTKESVRNAFESDSD